MSEELITYVYDGKEVYLTGRIAKRSSNSSKQPLVEIVPVGADKNDKEYAKWVSIEDLYLIADLDTIDIDDSKHNEDWYEVD